MATTPRRIVSCELPATVLKSLQEEANVRGVASHHQRAREILVEHFVDSEEGEIRELIAKLDHDLAYQGELIRRTVYSVMVHAAGFSSDEANEWIREHMARTRD